jgi:hypothetical protein
VNSCHPPQAFLHRGAFFNGVQTLLDINSFEAMQEYSIEFLVRLMRNGSLLSFDSEVFSEWRELQNHIIAEVEEKVSAVIMRVNMCGSI